MSKSQLVELNIDNHTNEFITLLQQANKESIIFDNIITNYNILFSKYLQKQSKPDTFEILNDENGCKSKEYKKLYQSYEEIKKKAEEQQSKNQKAYKDIFQVKMTLEKDQKNASAIKKDLITLTHKLEKLIEFNQTLILEKELLTKSRKDPTLLELQIQSLNDNIAKTQGENNLLTHQLQMSESKLNCKIEEVEQIKSDTNKRKSMADTLFNTSPEEYEEMVQKIDENYQTSVENVVIPKTLKIKFKPHKKGITSICFNAIGTNFISTSIDTFSKNWDCSKNTEIAGYAGFTGGVSEAVYDHSDQFLFAGSLDKTAKLWALKNNKLQCTYTGHIDYINCVRSFYSSLKAVTGSSDRTMKEWDFNTSKLSRNFSCFSACHCLGISSDDSFIISGHLDGTVRLWSSNDKPENMIDLHEDKILHLELIKNETQFLSLSKDYSIKLYDIRKMETVYTITDKILPQYCESSISVSSDKKYFSIGSVKGNVFVFNLKDGSLADTFDNKTNASILALQWRPNHSEIYVGDSAGYLTIWGTGSK